MCAALLHRRLELLRRPDRGGQRAGHRRLRTQREFYDFFSFSFHGDSRHRHTGCCRFIMCFTVHIWSVAASYLCTVRIYQIITIIDLYNFFFFIKQTFETQISSSERSLERQGSTATYMQSRGDPAPENVLEPLI